ncbi:MAG: precorrin-4 C(11)-methyltransferase [Deltaproteobacteria bacterium]|nr:MAG: precorrin-4 C(11)-methyltransferase [Deltaproteobacteria bacterium]
MRTNIDRADQTETAQVSFIGAGPGDPELITVKGMRLLQEADIVIYTGSLIPEALVNGLKASIHNSASLHLEEVFLIIRQGVEAGKRVVRLHTGDPALYGAINEQIALLRKHRIAFSIVPGVSSATAAAAALETELTHPEVSQTVIFTRRSGRTPVPEKERLEALASHQATMVIFLSVAMISEVVADLKEGGYADCTPVAVVEKASWPEQRIVRGNLATIVQKVAEAKIRTTAIIAVGEAIARTPKKTLSKLYDKGFSHAYRKGEPVR